MSIKSRLQSQSSSDSVYGNITDSSETSKRLEGASSEPRNRVIMTEGGSGGLPFVPTIRAAVSGAVKEGLAESGVATEDDVESLKQRLDAIETQIERINDDIEPLATKDDMRDLFEAYID